MTDNRVYLKIIEMIKDLDKGIRIVDLGCGQGELEDELRKLKFKNISYTSNEDIYDGKVKIMDFNRGIDYPDNHFDLVISVEVIEHLENKYLFLREIRRILKSSGILILTTPNVSSIYNRISFLFKGRFIEFNRFEVSHLNPFYLWEIKHHFKVKEVSYCRGFMPIFRVPFIDNGLFGRTLIIKCRKKGRNMEI